MEEDFDGGIRDDIYSKAVRAGKRTYFFDVKATRGNDLYLTITESKKRSGEEGRFYYEKHKLFLYKEDFEKFAEGLQEAIRHIDDLRSNDQEFSQPEDSYSRNENDDYVDNAGVSPRYTDVNFDDLDNAR